MTLRSRARPAEVRPARVDLRDFPASFWTITPPPPPPRAPESSYLRERYEALNCALTQPVVASVEFPASLDNRSNGSQGTSVRGMHARAASHKAQRALGERIARRFVADWWSQIERAPFAVVVLTRISPRALDSDGLETAFKSVRDGIAAGLGIDDRSSLVRYVTTQRRGEPREHAVRAELFIQPKEQNP